MTGGYRLARPGKDISFLDVIEAMEGPICLNLCCEGDRCECEHYKGCKMRDFWVKQQNSFRKALSQANFGKYKAILKDS